MGANDKEVDSIASVGSTHSSRDNKKGEAATAANLQLQQPQHHNNPAQQANSLDQIRDTVHISGE